MHVFCEDLGKYKQTDTNTQTYAVEENEKKHKQEIRLCKAANTLVAVGSLLEQEYNRCLPVCTGALMFISSTLRPSGNSVELQTV